MSRVHHSASSLLRWIQNLKLSQAKAPGIKTTWVAETQVLTHHLLYPRCTLAGRWVGGRVAETLTGLPKWYVGRSHCHSKLPILSEDSKMLESENHCYSCSTDKCDTVQ